MSQQGISVHMHTYIVKRCNKGAMQGEAMNGIECTSTMGTWGSKHGTFRAACTCKVLAGKQTAEVIRTSENQITQHPGAGRFLCRF